MMLNKLIKRQSDRIIPRITGIAKVLLLPWPPLRQKALSLLFPVVLMISPSFAQTPSGPTPSGPTPASPIPAADLLQKVRSRLDKVNDYQAAGLMKTDISFLKVPEAEVTVYFKKPDKLKIQNNKGISLVPKGAVTISLNNLLKGGYTVLDAGKQTMGASSLRVIKLLPQDENSDLVLATLYIDEGRLLVIKAGTTTRENGSYEIEMTYGKYAGYALPDKVVFTFNLKDYKLPKGMTFDYDDGSQKKPTTAANGNAKGKVEIDYSSYSINKGVPDTQFK